MSLFSRHVGRHCRHGSRPSRGSMSGWSSLAQLVPVPAALDFTGRLRTPLAISPMASPDYDTNSLERAS